MHRCVLGFALLLLGAAGNTQQVDYRVAIPQPTTRLVNVSIEIRDIDGEFIDVAMPMWTPGGYGASWFAKNVQEVRAETPDGHELDVRQVGTSQWRISTDSDAADFHYKVFLPSRRGSTPLDDTHYRFMGINTLMYVVGEDPYPAPGAVTLSFDAPEGWVFATGLEETAYGSFVAPDYDTLVDAPVEMAAKLEWLTFDHDNTKYELVIRNPHNLNREQFLKDVRRIVTEQTAMMGGAPFERYVFLLTGINTRGGGLEHLNSTTITFRRYGDMESPDYEHLQFLIAHEFFHLWNVKRIRPEILGPFDYSKPQHTRNLYIAEGITDYYAYLTAARAGVWSHEQFYEKLASVIEELQTSPGRLIRSVESASYRAWTRPDNSADADISFYTKGSLIGLLLDLEIRARTNSKRSLDDVFRYLLAEHGLPKPGFEEERGFQDAVSRTAAEGGGDADFRDFFDRYVAGVDELDYNAFLQHVGLQLQVEPIPGKNVPSLEIETAANGAGLVVTGLDVGGAGSRAGLMTDDILMLLNDERIDEKSLASRLKTIGVGGTAVLSVMRGDRLVKVPVVLAESMPLSYTLIEDESANSAAVKRRELWLKSYAP